MEEVIKHLEDIGFNVKKVNEEVLDVYPKKGNFVNSPTLESVFVPYDVFKNLVDYMKEKGWKLELIGVHTFQGVRSVFRYPLFVFRKSG